MKLLSVVIPLYNSQKTIEEVVDRIESAIEKISPEINHEIVLVNDGSVDDTKKVAVNISRQKKHVKLLDFSKNFGQPHAIMAGFNYIKGDYVVCLDDDLQTPPEEIYKLLEQLNENDYDVVYGHYKNKKHSKLRNIGSKINSFMQVVQINKPKNIKTSSYFIAKRFIIDKIIEYDMVFPYIPGLIFRTTDNVGNVLINHDSRVEGESNYTFKKLTSLWLNGLTNFSIKPLRVASFFGMLFSVISFIAIIALIIRKLVNPSVYVGWTSTIVTIVFFGGVQLLGIGILGEYIGRMFLCTNKSPQYVISEKYNFPNEDKYYDMKNEDIDRDIF